MSLIKQVLQLKQAGESNRGISRKLPIDKETVNGYVNTVKANGWNISDLLEIDDPELERMFHAGSPAYTDRRMEEFLILLPRYKELLADPKSHVSRQVLFDEYRATHPDGYGKSQFYYHLKQNLVAKKDVTAVLANTYRPGEKLMVDFAGDKLSYVDAATGEIIKVEVFVACMPYSDYIYVICVPSQKTGDFLHAIRMCLEHLGGVPPILTPDNLKSAVISNDRHEPKLNKALEDMGNYYHFVVLPCDPASPTQKALVEDSVRITNNRIYARLRNRTFHSLMELNRAVWELMERHNRTRMQKRPYSREERFHAMEKELLRRRFGPPIRLEISDETSPFLSQLLADQLRVSADEVYRLPAPLDATVLFELGGIDRPDLKYRPFIPTTNRQIAEVESSRAQDIFAAIRERDILLHHPYDSFSTSVQAFLAQAAADPKVLAIKQTLYRTSSNSPIIDALIDAAHAGKQVLALVEIKARFDEDANIAWARKLERAGVHVVYGIVGLKTHCKLSLVVRQEADGLRRYCHVGTGNYNPKTARIYTDLGLLTCDPVVGQDMTRLFNQLSGYAPKSSFHRLLVAPRTVRSGLIQRIRREEDAARAGKEAWIKIKVNSIVDEKTIDALYRASQAGVKIDIVERGICALKPGVPGLSENIRVRSILGRFLEHSRIYAFANSDGPQIGEGPAAGPEVWIGSADLMHRNLDRRVEALVRIVAPEQIDELIKYVDLQMADSTASWHMQADGTYVRHCKDEEGRPLVDSQEYLIKKHTRRPVRH